MVSAGDCPHSWPVECHIEGTHATAAARNATDSGTARNIACANGNSRAIKASVAFPCDRDPRYPRDRPRQVLQCRLHQFVSLSTIVVSTPRLSGAVHMSPAVRGSELRALSRVAFAGEVKLLTRSKNTAGSSGNLEPRDSKKGG
jgi:hypothetical protein